MHDPAGAQIEDEQQPQFGRLIDGGGHERDRQREAGERAPKQGCARLVRWGEILHGVVVPAKAGTHNPRTIK